MKKNLIKWTSVALLAITFTGCKKNNAVSTVGNTSNYSVTTGGTGLTTQPGTTDNVTTGDITTAISTGA